MWHVNRFRKPTGQALQAEKSVPGPCPWINQRGGEGPLDLTIVKSWIYLT
jgi:hypothetical protein